ncbi:hypothetical protein EDB19DRAFT_394300 [Suillus lakei]|nr:hypothetical protein EDB19DRAFT_394300 [Suillus lakei]
MPIGCINLSTGDAARVPSICDRILSSHISQEDTDALDVELAYHIGNCTFWPPFHSLLWQDVATENASADTNYDYYEQVRSFVLYFV